MNAHRAIFYSVLNITIICGLATIFTAYYYFKIKRQTIQQALQTANQELDRATDTMYDYMRSIENTVRKIATSASMQKIDQNQLESLCQKALAENKNINSIAIAYEPFAFDQEKRLFGFVYRRTAPHIEQITYDYTSPTNTQTHEATWWFVDTIKNGAQWHKPIYSQKSKSPIVLYGSPFYASNDADKRKPIGAITAAIAPTLLNDLTKTLVIGDAGFGIIFDKSGTMVAHPIQTFVSQGKTLAQIAQESLNASLLAITPTILSTSSGSLMYVDDLNNEPATFNYRAVEHTNLYLSAVFIHNELLAPFADVLRKYIIFMVCLGLATLIGILILSFPYLRLTITSLMACVFIIIAISLLWYTKRLFIPQNMQDSIAMIRKANVERIIKQAQAHVSSPIIAIKTGIYLTSIEYPEPNQVAVSGFMWQRYPLSLPKTIPHEPLLSDCNRFFEKTKIATIANNHEEILFWMFSALLNQPHFNANNFPFDEQNIRITIENESLQFPLIIVPDIDAYRVISPIRLPGISTHINLNERFFIKNFFTLAKITRDIDWRIPVSSTNQYRLQFNVLSRRYLTNAINIYLLPILVALVFLHVCLLLIARDEGRLLTSISLAASIFLSMTFLHSALRKDVAATGICYFEYFYILLYVVICLVITDLLLYNKNFWLARWITYQNNTWATHLLAPCYLLTIFILTAIIFY